MAVIQEAFGKNIFCENVELFVLTNSSGMEIRILNYGGIIQSLKVPDRRGKFIDVVLGHDTAEEYTEESPHFGSITGRVAGRIAGGGFVLDGVKFHLPQNSHGNTLHGGMRGFDKRIWNTEILTAENALKLTYLSPDGEEGFPGEVKASVIYTLTDSGELKIDYTAESTRATPFVVTNHSYFNLAGHDSGSAMRQVLTINADKFLPVDEQTIPYGEERAVEGTPFDFRAPRVIGERIDADDEQLRSAGGYDHTYCLNKTGAGELSFAARAIDPKSGRVLDVFTTEPGMVFYTGNFLGGTLKGKGGRPFVKRAGFCLETQHYPDSPNQPQFPDSILRPGRPYVSQTIFKFSSE
ncbi:MAG: aldose epimerase family protein [Kiritimatiellales bacterium]